MKSEERRRLLGQFRPAIFLGGVASLLFSAWLMKDTNPRFFSRVLEETVNWGWTEWLLLSALLLSVLGVASWFAPKVYCDYIESVEQERAAAAAHRRASGGQ